MPDIFTFPNSEQDPKKKGKEYILQYVRAAYGTSKSSIGTSLYFGSDNMSEIRDYAQGAQSLNKYKKQLLPDENQDDSWQSIDWEVLQILPKFREIAIAKIMQQRVDIQAFAIDALSKSEEDEYFNKMKVKITMREAAAKLGSELAESPLLKANPKEPEDLEQLSMEREFGYKHVMAMEAELAYQLSSQNNDGDEIDKSVVENLFDYGIGGRTQWIDENGMTKERAVDMSRAILSYCTKCDFSDLQYWGEVLEVSLTDLAPYFSREEMERLCQKVKGQYGNPLSFDATQDKYWERFKALVLDFKFLDWNSTAYESKPDANGNDRFRKADFKKLAVNVKGDMIEEDEDDNEGMHGADGKPATPKYIKSTRKVLYKCKWIIDTEFLYDYGLSENMVRKQSCWWDTGLDIQLYAWNFEKMKFHGMTERLIPLADDIQMTWYKKQNLRNKLLPYIINMDLDSFEGIGFGKGGANMKPDEVVDFLFSNYIALYRSRDKLTNNPNYKPVSVESTGQLNMLVEYTNEMLTAVELMRQISGLNEITDGSAPNPKNLNSTNQAAAIGTNNALWPIYNARKHIALKAADNTICKQQIAVKLGKVEGLVRAMGSDSLKMFQINPDLSLREFGLSVEDAPTDAQREQLWQEISIKESQGMLTIEDKILVMTVRNLKQAQMMLGYRIRKRQEKREQFELAKIKENNNGQQQMIATSEQLKQQTIQFQLQADLQRIETEKRWDYQIAAMSKQAQYETEKAQADARTIGHSIQAEAKVQSSLIAAEGSLQKQNIANKKPSKVA